MHVATGNGCRTQVPGWQVFVPAGSSYNKERCGVRRDYKRITINLITVFAVCVLADVIAGNILNSKRQSSIAASDNITVTDNYQVSTVDQSTTDQVITRTSTVTVNDSEAVSGYTLKARIATSSIPNAVVTIASASSTTCKIESPCTLPDNNTFKDIAATNDYAATQSNGDTTQWQVKITIPANTSTGNYILDIEYDEIAAEPVPINFSYTGDAQEFTVENTGTYKIELWGAQGGSSGGKGGYTSGEIDLTMDETLYIYIGDLGRDQNTSCSVAAFNGGGGRTQRVGCGSGGGGGTDVRLLGGTWSDTTGLRSRIMVSGGGGGAGSNGTNVAGVAGGLTGASASTSDSRLINAIGQGAIQTAGGTAPTRYNCGSTYGTTGTAGAFGRGGTGGRNEEGLDDTSDAFGGGSGGGGGYYGGSGASGICNGSLPGGGGSSFISGHPDANAINLSGAHTGQPNHYSGKIFTNTVMIAGNGVMPAPDDTTETGHAGAGYARITPIRYTN